jgi:glycosyltransferase involved in cell wall biosynthesis
VQHDAPAARRLKIVLLTDVFPPGSGGSGWSTYFLGKALRERGHGVYVIRPRYDEGVARVERRIVEYGGLAVEELLVPAAPDWVSNLGVGKAWQERTAKRAMSRRAESAVVRSGADVLHGQHSVSARAASAAALSARRMGARVVSVATVRDYWPLCPVSTRLFEDKDGQTFECTDCHNFKTYMGCVDTRFSNRESKIQSLPSSKATGPKSKIPRWLATWSGGRELARCDAIIAVSEYVRGELARSGRVPEEKLVTIPNLVHLPSVQRALSGPWPLNDISPEAPFLLFVGKLDTNKGVRLLPEAVARSGMRMPLVLAGDGPLRSWLEDEARRRNLDFRFHDWLDNDAVLRLMHGARALVFPSEWQEPLSRVLLEGCAAGAAIVALDTGGTRDIIVHNESGWLARNLTEFSVGIARVSEDDALNRRLRSGARQRAEQRFASALVTERVEKLYLSLLARAEHA